MGGMHLADVDRPCETFNYAKRTDSTAIWVNLVWSFPGTGRDFPIRAGEAKAISLDATPSRSGWRTSLHSPLRFDN